MDSQKKWLLISVIVATVAASAIGVVIFLRVQSPVPKSVTDQTTFVVMVPKGEGIEVDKSSMAVSKPQDVDTKVLNYIVNIDGIEVLVGQQPTPQQFIDIPKVYEKVVEQSKPYGSFETVVGTVNLTRPQKQQIAMMNSKGTYLLAQATQDLTEDQWRRFFKGIQLVE